MRQFKYRVVGTGAVVSSRREGCTHALMKRSSGKVFSLYPSMEGALEGLRGWEALNFNDMYGRRVLDTDRVWVLGPSLQQAIRHLGEHDRMLKQEGMARALDDWQEASWLGVAYYGFRAADRDLERAREVEGMREAWLKDVTVVMLEAI